MTAIKRHLQHWLAMNCIAFVCDGVYIGMANAIPIIDVLGYNGQ